MNLYTVISRLISDSSSLTTKHMVFFLQWPWTWNEYAYPGTDLWVTKNEFHTSLIPDLLFTSWPNMWVGLVDAQLDQNDCLGDWVLLLVQSGGSRCLPSYTPEMLQSNVVLWSKRKVYNETFMRFPFRRSKGHNFEKHEANHCLQTPLGLLLKNLVLGFEFHMFVLSNTYSSACVYRPISAHVGL